MSISTNSNIEVFNSRLYISPVCFENKFSSPQKERIDTNDNSSLSISHSGNNASPFSSEKSKRESCLMSELLNRLDECSPAKPIDIIGNPKENASPFSNEKNYLLEFYLNKSNKENQKSQENNVNFSSSIVRHLNFSNEKKIGFGKGSDMFSRNEGEDNTQWKNKHTMKGNGHFKGRVGDWTCIKCNNVNFGFRKMCNRCGISKESSEKQYNIIASNLLTMLSGN